jgi:hypothetical protein
MIYPIFILLLPISIPNWLIVLIGFTVGLSVDFFYDSIGIHAAACTFLGFVRSGILELIKPNNDYAEFSSPTKKRYGIGWFLLYVSISLLAFLLFYFSVEAYTFVYWKEILIKTGSSFVFSFLIIMIYQFIFDPAE